MRDQSKDAVSLTRSAFRCVSRGKSECYTSGWRFAPRTRVGPGRETEFREKLEEPSAAVTFYPFEFIMHRGPEAFVNSKSRRTLIQRPKASSVRYAKFPPCANLISVGLKLSAPTLLRRTARALFDRRDARTEGPAFSTEIKTRRRHRRSAVRRRHVERSFHNDEKEKRKTEDGRSVRHFCKYVHVRPSRWYLYARFRRSTIYRA